MTVNKQPHHGYKTTFGRELPLEPAKPATTTVTFSVEGRAAPQGSKRAFLNPHTGRVAMVEASRKLKPWRDTVRQAAREAVGATQRPWEGAVGVSLTFVFLRPKSHYGTGKNSHLLKPSSPAWPASRSVPDLDKTERGILDAMTGVVFADDSQVCTMTSRKVWGWPERVEVSVALLGPGLDYDQSEQREAA